MPDDPPAPGSPGTLVLGIGNVLLCDEGAGVHALDYLCEHHAGLPGVRYLDGGTLSFTLAGAVEDAERLIVLDAARLDAAPGTVRCFEAEEMDRFLGTGKCSVHEVGLADLMDIARLTDSLPARRALIGIQPQTIGWGEHPTPAVAAALPRAAGVVLELLHRWDAEAQS